MTSRIIVLGASFAGLTAALELKRRLGDRHDVVVISKSADFIFLPSLIWVPFGLRNRDEISFPVRPVLEAQGISVHEAEVTRIDLDERHIFTDRGVERYDHLVIATGARPDHDAVPGLGPRRGHTHTIVTWEEAELARRAFERFLESPGPVIVGAVPGASDFGPTYEFLFNMAHQLRRRGLKEKAPLTLITPEPYPGHLGLGGFGGTRKVIEAFLQKLDITAITGARIGEITPGQVHLSDGGVRPFAYAVLTPPFVGVDAVRSCSEIVNAAGFVKISDAYQAETRPEVFAAGSAAAVSQPGSTPVPCGAAVTGYISEEMARIVAHNIAAHLDGEPMIELSPASIHARGVLDAGDSGIIMAADRFVEPTGYSWLVPGPEAHWVKLGFEKYFLATRRRGNIQRI